MVDSRKEGTGQEGHILFEKKEEARFASQKLLGAVLFGLGVVIIILYFLIQNFFDIRNPNNDLAMNEDAQQDGLTPEQRYIIEEKGTEIPFTSELLDEKRPGTYYAVDTKEPVFRSEDKFDSGTGWPSFTKPINPQAVEEQVDKNHGMTRTEVTSTEGGHLGHVFPDGPADKGGLRYCINGDALYFVPDDPKKGEE